MAGGGGLEVKEKCTYNVGLELRTQHSMLVRKYVDRLDRQLTSAHRSHITITTCETRTYRTFIITAYCTQNTIT